MEIVGSLIGDHFAGFLLNPPICSPESYSLSHTLWLIFLTPSQFSSIISKDWISYILQKEVVFVWLFCIWEGHGDLTTLYTDFYLLIMPSVFSLYLTLSFCDTIPFFFLIHQGELILLLLSIFIIDSLYPFALLLSLFVFRKLFEISSLIAFCY